MSSITSTCYHIVLTITKVCQYSAYKDPFSRKMELNRGGGGKNEVFKMDAT